MSRRASRRPRDAAPSEPLARAGRPALALGVAALLLAVLPYLNALSCGFALDDASVVVDNPLLQSPLDVGRIFTSNLWGERETLRTATLEAAQRAPEQKGLYRPVTVLSFALERAVWGLAPPGYHAVNLLLHALASWLVFMIALQVLASPFAALAAAALFAAHPVHTEAVTNVAGRAELLAAVCYLMALWLCLSRWVRGTRVEAPAALGVVLLYFLGLCSKESAVTLPGVLVACAVALPASARVRVRSRAEGGQLEGRRQERPGAPRNAPSAGIASPARFGHGRAWTHWGVLFGGLLLALGAFLVLRSGAVKPAPILWGGFVGVSVEHRLLTASRVLMEYLGLLLWPGTLRADYWLPEIPIARSWTEPAVLASLLLWPALAAAAVLAWRRSRAIALGLAWFFLTILPVSNLVLTIGVAKAERLLYAPSIGICLLAGAVVAITRKAGRWERPVLFALFAAVVACSVRTWMRNRDWRDGPTLALATLRTTPTSPVFNSILGVEYRKLGDYARAQPYLETALREARPEYYGDSYYLGSNLLSLGRYDEAEYMLRRAVQLRPVWPAALNNLGEAQIKAGRYDEAVRTLGRIPELDRSYVGAYINLGTAYLGLGDAERAARVFRDGLAISPAHAQLHNNLAVALKRLGRTDEALRERERAVALDPAASHWQF